MDSNGKRWLFRIVAGITISGAIQADPKNDKEIQYSHECASCHTGERKNYRKIFERSGAKLWSPEKCYGCHSEVNEVLGNMAAGLQDYRQYVMHRSQLLRRISAEKMVNYLPYMQAPLQLNLVNKDGSARISPERLSNFLRQPSQSYLSNKYGMISFPNVSSGSSHFKKPKFENVETGKLLWNNNCKTVMMVKLPHQKTIWRFLQLIIYLGILIEI